MAWQRLGSRALAASSTRQASRKNVSYPMASSASEQKRFLTDTLALSVLVGCAAGLRPVGVALIGLALLLRIMTHAIAGVRLGAEKAFRPWLVPIRDAMTFAVRVASFVGRDVRWREHEFSVRADGHLVVNN